MIKLGEKRYHQKASETYQNVEFKYGNEVFNWDIPIEYRRTGTDFTDKSEEEIMQYLKNVRKKCNPKNWKKWKLEQAKFWKSKSQATVTKEFFDVLISDFKWHSVETDLPKNPNWARRIQDIKELGYTLATNTKMYDKVLGRNCTHLLLLPLPRGGMTGYETWTKETRDKILSLLRYFDEYEAKAMKKEGLLPDHKFPEIRWDTTTKRNNINRLSNKQILNGFSTHVKPKKSAKTRSM